MCSRATASPKRLVQTVLATLHSPVLPTIQSSHTYKQLNITLSKCIFIFSNCLRYTLFGFSYHWLFRTLHADRCLEYATIQSYMGGQCHHRSSSSSSDSLATGNLKPQQPQQPSQDQNILFWQLLILCAARRHPLFAMGVPGGG